MRSNVTINERIKDLRTEKKLNLEELSEKTGIPKTTLGDYEQDGSQIPHTAVMTLSEFYGVSSDYLLDKTDIRKPSGTSIQGIHFSEDAVDMINSGKINTRLLSEIISHPDFVRLMIDAEVFTDGYFEEAVQNYNTLTDNARDKLMSASDTVDDTYKQTIEYTHLLHEDYFAHLLTADFLPILNLSSR